MLGDHSVTWPAESQGSAVSFRSSNSRLPRTYRSDARGERSHYVDSAPWLVRCPSGSCARRPSSPSTYRGTSRSLDCPVPSCPSNQTKPNQIESNRIRSHQSFWLASTKCNDMAKRDEAETHDCRQEVMIRQKLHPRYVQMLFHLAAKEYKHNANEADRFAVSDCLPLQTP
jgi:hypothetical protein